MITAKMWSYNTYTTVLRNGERNGNKGRTPEDAKGATCPDSQDYTMQDEHLTQWYNSFEY